MFRVWGKLIKENKLIKDTVIAIDDPEMRRTPKVYKALEDMCYEFDLAINLLIHYTVLGILLQWPGKASKI